MRTWPSGEFWSLWLRALAVILASIAFLVFHPPAHAALWKTSFYGAESGRLNADGTRFEPMGFTAAHRSLPFGTRLQACYRSCVVVTVRDRGPALWTGRALDLAHGAARAIGLESVGVGMVDIVIVGRADITRGTRHVVGVGRRKIRHALRRPAPLRRALRRHR